MKNFNGDIKYFPKEIVLKMMEYQVEQGNVEDVSVFERDIKSGDEQGGFTWGHTLEGDQWWGEVIVNKNFNKFFETYPTRLSKDVSIYPKVLMVSNNPIDKDNVGVPRVVFAKKDNRFIAWYRATTIEDAENVLDTFIWLYAKEVVIS